MVPRSIFIFSLLVAAILLLSYFLIGNERIRAQANAKQLPPSDNSIQVFGESSTNKDVHVDSNLKQKEFNDTHIANETSKKIHSMNKRHLKSYTIEVAVAVDEVLQNRYGSQTKKYVEIVISKASELYSKSNLVESINLSVTNIIYIKNKLGEPATMGKGKDASKLLSKFCKYMKKSHLKYNAAILITGYDIYSSKNLVGLAYIGTMCTEDACVLIEDKGLQWTPSIIAHELGHSLNSFHDGDSECADLPKNDWKSIMSSELDKSSKIPYWSKCSRQSISTFLRTKKANCLLQSGRKKSGLVKGYFTQAVTFLFRLL